MDVGWVSAVVALVGAAVAAASVVVTVVEGRRTRRNTEFSVHRDLWWQRWTGVERALSRDPDDHDAAALMTYALTTRSWVTEDDAWVLTELEKAERRRLGERGTTQEDEPDDHR